MGDGVITPGDGVGGGRGRGSGGACDRSLSFNELCTLLNATQPTYRHHLCLPA